MTNEPRSASTFTNESKTVASLVNEAFSWLSAVYSVARFGKSSFGQGKKGSGGPYSPFSNETKNSVSLSNETPHSSSFSNETKH